MRRYGLGCILLVAMGAWGGCANGKAGSGVCITAEPARVLRHVVLVAFKEGTTPEQVREIEAAFSELPATIEAIQYFEWGRDVSVEDRADGFTHCFFVTFKDEAGRDVYLPHPAHQAFVEIAGPHIEKVLVVDYWAQH
ncbi:MAG: Dabb family protein [Phycisphaerae bacterium]|nr:Dabb family protein [Phycisphaerae bacterium]